MHYVDKIVHVNKAYFPKIGGVETVCRQYALVSKNVFQDVTVLTIGSKRGWRIRRTDDNGIKILACDYQFKLFRHSFSLAFLILLVRGCFQDQVIHCHDPFPLASVPLALMKPKRLMVTYHADLVRPKLVKPLVDLIRKRALKNAYIITTTSTRLARNSDVLRCVDQDKIKVVPIYLDELDSYSTRLSDDVIKQLSKDISSIQFESVAFLMLGRMVYYKGLDVLLKAMMLNKKLEKQVSGKILIVGPVGDSVARKQLNDLRQYSSDIIFRERLISNTEKLHLLQNVGTLLFLSNQKSEAFGIMQLEAIAAGVAVVNFNINTGVPEVGLDGVTGHTLDLNDHIGLARLLHNPGKYGLKNLSKSVVKQHIQNGFSKEKSCALMIDIYSTMRRL